MQHDTTNSDAILTSAAQGAWFGHDMHCGPVHYDGTFAKTTPVGFEPTRGDPIGLAGRRLNRSAKVSMCLVGVSMSVWLPLFF